MKHPISSRPIGAAVVPERQVRANQHVQSVFVYQAFGINIAAPALTHQRFVPPFRRGRMTWIKPSFAWMMYRSGWGQKVGQERILRIELSKQGFTWALKNSSLSAYVPTFHCNREEWLDSLRENPVRIQWDPERDLRLNPLPWRTIQIGLGLGASSRYVDEWIMSIEDYTDVAATVLAAVRSGEIECVRHLIPTEEPVVLAEDISARIGATGSSMRGPDCDV